MTPGFLSKITSLPADGWSRFARARVWVVLQFAGLALLIAFGLLWTRIPEKRAGQVLLTLLLPLLIAAAFLGLQAGTIRSMLRPFDADRTDARVSFFWGSATLLVWIAIGWLLWGLVDRFDDHIYNWAGYLNSRFDPHSRSHFATYEHFTSWLGKASWVLRWVIVPGLLLPLGCSAAYGFRRLPWKRSLRAWIDWRWWPVLLVLALIGQAWPFTFFDTLPHGTVDAQVWRVVFKVLGAYLLAVLCWIFAIVWCLSLVARPEQGGSGADSPLRFPRDSRRENAPLSLSESEHDIGGNA
jgi:hypothetical protein